MYPLGKIALCAVLFTAVSVKAQQCPPGDYTCTGSNPLQCGLESWRCDGSAQCANGADEVGCPGTTPSGPLDGDSECCRWASLCECQKNRAWMVPNCQRSCGTGDASADNVDSATITIHPDCQPTTDCDATTTAAATTAAATAAPQQGGGQDELYIVYAQPPVNVNNVLHKLGVGPLNFDNVQVVDLSKHGGGGGGHHGGQQGGGYGQQQQQMQHGYNHGKR